LRQGIGANESTSEEDGMTLKWQAKNEFRFYTCQHLLELTGKKARDLRELLDGIREADDSVIFNHTHNFLIHHHYLKPEPPSAFAHWIAEFLHEDRLAEKLYNINTVEFNSIRDLKEEMIRIIDKYLEENGSTAKAPKGEEFHFVRSIDFVFPTFYVATNLYEFVEALKVISPNSIYFHFFMAKLRLERGENDFSYWIETSVDAPELASKINRLDPYMYTLEELREAIIAIIERELYKVLKKDLPENHEGRG